MSTLHLLPLGPSEEGVLVEQLQQGVPEAYSMLYRRYVGRVLGVATQVLGDRAGAEDVAQEAFLKVFREIHRFRGDGRLVSWIHRITVNLAISELRRRKRAREHRAQLPAEDRVDLGASEPELTESLRSVLAQLEPAKRITFYLHHVEGLSGAELAEVLGESRDAVLKRLQRTRRELLALWEDPEASDDAGAGARARGGA